MKSDAFQDAAVLHELSSLGPEPTAKIKLLFGLKKSQSLCFLSQVLLPETNFRWRFKDFGLKDLGRQ